LNDFWRQPDPSSELSAEPLTEPSPEPDTEQVTEPSEIALCPQNTDASSNCVIEGDLVVNGTVPMNGSIVENNTITIVGVINVTGNVVVTSDSTVKISPGSILHVGKCLLLEEDSEIVIVVEGGMSGNEEQLVATYDGNCS